MNVKCNNGYCKFDSYTTTKINKNMKVYSEDKLRLKLSILRMGKAMNQLKDSGLIELTICELLLENHLNNKYKEINEWLNKNGFIKILI